MMKRRKTIKILKFLSNTFKYFRITDLFFSQYLQSSYDELIWTTRSSYSHDDWSGAQDVDWILNYWDSKTHPHRKCLTNTIYSYNPRTILEIGSNCGPNLFLLSQVLPNTTLVGVDINNESIIRGKRLFLEHGIKNVELISDNISFFFYNEKRKFDIIFSDAVLIYIGPDKFMGLFKQMLDHCNDTIILCEWHDPESSLTGKNEHHWVRNYLKLKDEFPNINVKFTPISKETWNDFFWQKYGNIIEIRINHGK